MLPKLTNKQLALVLGAVGLFYVAAPHRLHMEYSPDYLLGVGQSHEVHVAAGAAMVAGALYLYTRK